MFNPLGPNSSLICQICRLRRGAYWRISRLCGAAIFPASWIYWQEIDMADTNKPQDAKPPISPALAGNLAKDNARTVADTAADVARRGAEAGTDAVRRAGDMANDTARRGAQAVVESQRQMAQDAAQRFEE